MPAIHYKYGGSTAGRTLQCPSWMLLSDKLPRIDSSSTHADRGTLLHDCMEELLRYPELLLSELLGRTYKDQVVNDEEIEFAIGPAINAYGDFANENDIALELPEMEVKYADNVGGTSDLIAVNKDTVFILDWKFGFHRVGASENPQGLFYAMCAREDVKTRDLFKGRDKLCIVIVQPGDGAILSTWNTDIDRLNMFEDEYVAAQNRQQEDTPVTGSYCQFCPAMAICPAKTGVARKALMMNPDSKDAQGLGEALDLADEVIAWANSVKKLAHEQAEQGLKINGYKLVDKRATRKWADEKEVLDMVRKARKLKLEEAVDMKVKTPPQLEKLCKKKGVDFQKYAAYIEAVSSGTTLTTSDDKRPEAFNIAGFAAAINVTE